jgi:2'-5' RNA ligase
LSDLRAKHPRVRWLPLDKLHLTLVFLGSMESARVALLTQALRDVADHRGPFDVATAEAGGRLGGRGGGVAWLRLADGGHEVAQLALDVDEAIGSGTYDARHTPRPHLTVARGVTEAALADLRVAAAGLSVTWTVDRVVLFRSHTGPAGSRYEELGSAMLSG